MEKKFKAKDKLAKRAERKIAIENGTYVAAHLLDDESDDDDADEDDSD